MGISRSLPGHIFYFFIIFSAPLISNLQQLPAVSFSSSRCSCIGFILCLSACLSFPACGCRAGRLPVGLEPWFLFNSLFLPALSKVRVGEGSMLPPCGRSHDCANSAICPVCACVFQRGWKLSRPRPKLPRQTEETRDWDQQRLTQLDFTF